MDYHITLTKIRNQMIVPAMDSLIKKLAFELPSEVITLIQSKKNNRLPVSTIVKYIQEDNDNTGLISCMVRYLGK